MKYHLVTLGCQMNLSDGERVHSVLEGMGYSQTDREEEADILGIIACSVRQKAIDKVYSRIAKWNKWKNSKNLLTFISGCLLPSDKEKFLKLFDIVFPMSELSQLPESIQAYGVVTPVSLQNKLSVPQNEFIVDLWNIKPKYQSEFEAFVPIQNGCDKFCTFCAVPYTRGREVSRASEDIINQVKELVEQGYKSITLLGQNVNSYGLDKKGEEISFHELLEKIGQFGAQSQKEFWVYFTSPHPRDMNREVIEVMSRYACLAKQIHLPLQSGDNKVLVRMNRKHSISTYEEIVKNIRELIPEATLFTDIIVGFSGETDEQFQHTIDAFEQFRFNMAYIAQYSPRPGAAAYRWSDDIPHEVKKERFHKLSEVLLKISSEENKKRIQKRVKVLVTGKERKPGFLSALTEGKMNVRIPSDNEALIGDIIEVDLVSVYNFSFEAKLVEEAVLEKE